MGSISYFLTFIEGLLTFISPCILPMLPLYFVYLAGSSENNDKEKKYRLIVNSLGFVLGFTIVFVILGATATSLGYFLKSHKDILRQISGIIVILFGLNFIGILKLNFLNAEKRFSFNFEKLRFFSSVLFGIVFGFGWSPCLGALLGAALAKASNADTVWQGITLLLAYSMGLGVPFIISAVIFDKLKGAFNFIKKNGRILSVVSGILLVIIGVLIFMDILKYISF